jgi:hypothetical protein
VITFEAARPQLNRIKDTLAEVVFLDLSHNRSEYRAGGDEIRVVQHMSSTCRAARLAELHDVPMARVLRHIDDIDVEKCRESRTQYLGPFTYTIVVLTVSFVVLNQAAGDMIVDHEISSLISAFLLANAYLYMHSIVVFMIVYLAVAGILVYIIAVFMPAKKTVLRMKATSRSSAEAALASQRSLRSEIRPVTHMKLKNTQSRIIDRLYADIIELWHYIATLIVFLSPAKAKEIKLKRSKPWKEMWMRLNIPTANHGQVIGAHEEKKEARRRSSISRHMVAYTANSIPKNILAMRPPSWLEKWVKEDEMEYILHKVSQRIFGTEQYLLPSDKARAFQEAVFHVASNVSVELSQRVQTFILSPDVAADKIIRRLTTREMDIEEGFDLSTGKFQTTALVLDLFEKFSEIWSEFLPAGHQLSSEEIGEAKQMFLLWTVGSGLCQGDDRIGVDTFKKWFVEVLYPAVSLAAPPSVPIRGVATSAAGAAGATHSVSRDHRRSMEWGEDFSLSDDSSYSSSSSSSAVELEIGELPAVRATQPRTQVPVESGTMTESAFPIPSSTMEAAAETDLLHDRTVEAKDIEHFHYNDSSDIDRIIEMWESEITQEKEQQQQQTGRTTIMPVAELQRIPPHYPPNDISPTIITADDGSATVRNSVVYRTI